MNESTISLGTSGTEMGAGTSMVGEERVQCLFTKALQDGYILCQYICSSGLWLLCMMDRNANIHLL